MQHLLLILNNLIKLGEFTNFNYRISFFLNNLIGCLLLSHFIPKKFSHLLERVKGEETVENSGKKQQRKIVER